MFLKTSFSIGLYGIKSYVSLTLGYSVGKRVKPRIEEKPQIKVGVYLLQNKYTLIYNLNESHFIHHKVHLLQVYNSMIFKVNLQVGQSS